MYGVNPRTNPGKPAIAKKTANPIQIRNGTRTKHNGKIGHLVMYNGKPTFVPIPPTTSLTGIEVKINDKSRTSDGRKKLFMIGNTKEDLKPYAIWWNIMGWFKEVDPVTKKEWAVTANNYKVFFVERS